MTCKFDVTFGRTNRRSCESSASNFDIQVEQKCLKSRVFTLPQFTESNQGGFVDIFIIVLLVSYLHLYSQLFILILRVYISLFERRHKAYKFRFVILSFCQEIRKS